MRVLVSVASRYGATREIAEAIGRVLSDRGHDVDVVAAEDTEDLGRYDAVVLGAGVYAGQWLRAGRELLDRAADDLAATRLWVFSSGPVGEGAELVGPPLMDEPLGRVGPEDHAVFGGKLDHHQLMLGDKAVAQSLHAVDGDYRDFEAVERWAASIASALEA